MLVAELPWFKFTPDAWLSGVISDLDYETQGVFTAIMALYWKGGCSLEQARLRRRLRVVKARLDEIVAELVGENVLTIADGMISIKFLDEQLQELTDKKEALSIAGKKGAEVLRLRREAEALLKGGYSNKNKDKDLEEDKETEPLKRLFSSNYKIFKSEKTHDDWWQVINEFRLVNCIKASVQLLNDPKVKDVYPNTLAAQIVSMQASEHAEQQEQLKRTQKNEQRRINENKPDVDKAKVNQILNNRKQQEQS